MDKNRLDQELVKRGLVSTRSQAESYIKLGDIKVNDRVVTKPGFLVAAADEVSTANKETYVGRAGLKLASVAKQLSLNFKDKTVLDVGSSTGGFTDYSLKQGAKKVIAVDVGTNQLHPSLHGNKRIELHEKTDIRDFANKSHEQIDIVLIDVSFISLRQILPAISRICSPKTAVLAMAKPQFEAGEDVKHGGVIKNEKARREVLKALEEWVKNLFVITGKADSKVAGAKGNLERFYLLAPVRGKRPATVARGLPAKP